MSFKVSPREFAADIFTADTLIAVLRQRAEAQREEIVYEFLGDADAEPERLTYGELDSEARAIASLLQLSNAAGRPVLLVYPPGLRFIGAFFGCLYAGAIPTPAYPPASEKHAQRLSAIVSDCRPALGLTTAAALKRISASVEGSVGFSTLEWLVTDGLDVGLARGWTEPEIVGRTTALLQYTSGSTGNPKGVMISHANLLHNQKLIHESFGQNENSVIVSWLPLYHDMGLIGAVLQPVYVGARCILTPPAAFLQRPAFWLETISRYRATTSGGPNFAFDLCARKVTAEQKQSLDLRSWSVAFNGAEPILADTLERFATAFEGCGFRREALRPCYGLAEATLLVSAESHGAPRTRAVDARALERGVIVEPFDLEAASVLVSSGERDASQEVLIVDPETLVPCEEGCVGEVWVSGPSVSCGYWGRPQETSERLQAHLANGDRTNFLRTGDLGFTDRGSLFVTGRLSELIILNGLNYYPLDIETSAQKIDSALRPGCGAAFSIESEEGQRVVLLQEVERTKLRTAERLLPAIRDEVARTLEIALAAVVLLTPHALPKTSSGKIQRAACRELFLRGELKVVASWSAAGEKEPQSLSESDHEGPRSPLENLICQVWAEALEIDSVVRNDNFLSLGGDSVAATRAAARIVELTGVQLEAHQIFEHPTVAQLTRVVEEAATRLPSAALQLSPSPERQEVLSLEQEGVWLEEQLHPGRPTYNVPMAMRVKGVLDQQALKLSFDEIVRRHETLRTTFAVEAGKPVTRVSAALSLEMQVVDLSDLTVKGSESMMQRLVQLEAHRLFDLEKGPLVRALLVRLSDRSHVIALTVHHLIFDGWSAEVLLRELSIMYPALTRGEEPLLAPLSIQYADHAAWQRRRFEEGELDPLLAYWRQKLAGAPTTLELPTDRPRRAQCGTRGAHFTFELDRGLVEKLTVLGREESSTLFMTLLAGFQLLIEFYTGEKDFLIGTPASNRARSETQTLVGLLANTLVLRSDLSANPNFRELVRRARATVLEAQLHEDAPFGKLVEKVQPARDLSRSPLIQMMIVLENAPGQIRIGELTFERVPVEIDAAMHDLTMIVAETAAGLNVTLNYDSDLFDAQTIRRLGMHLRRLLEAAVNEPARPVAELPMLDDEERQRLLFDWNNTSLAHCSDQCLYELFETQVELTPDATALVCEDLRLTYSELDRRANRLAVYLRRLGVGPEVAVGVCLNRTAEMVIAVLGILKAGGAYVPLDPTYPVQRLAWMVQDAGVRVALTEQRLRHVLAGSTVEAVCLDELSGPGPETHALAGGVRSEARSDNLAYVIYTSGSTGRPKGVAITHRSAVVLIDWALTVYTRAQLAGVLASTSLNFDLSVFELFAPLSCGGKVILADNALQLPELEARAEVTLINTVPSAISELLAAHGLPASAKVVNLAGEALPRETVRRLYETGTVEQVYNLYGPTEDTTYSSFELVPPGETGVPAIGRPVAGTRCYLLGRRQRLVPLGARGELFLAGAGLARGYLGRAGLTAERFVPDPFAAPAGGRLYRTGDVARYQADGRLLYLGRGDGQVKLRGYRIELGEVEHELRQEPGVREAAVAVRGVGSAAQLVGYVVWGEGGGTVAAVTRELRSRLPEYMVPSVVLELEGLPLTPNGKLDRKALPEPAAVVLEGTYEVPRDAVEEKLAGIWSEVLGIERVGVRDNFFDLGGHSLLATRIVARVGELFAVELPLRCMFETPTIAGLAERVSQCLRKSAGKLRASPLERVEREGELPLSYEQERMWFLWRLDPDSSAYNLAGGVRLRGRLDRLALGRALDDVVRRHEVLRTTFHEKDGWPAQVIYGQCDPELTETDLSCLPGAELELEAMQVARQEARRPFDLSRRPLLRARLLRLGEDHLLVLTMHHIISDGWSIGILMRELKVLYTAYSRGEEAQFAELPFQYADYSAWQRRRLAGGVLDEQLTYWRKHLAGGSELLELPTDHPRPADESYQGASLAFNLPPSFSEAIRKLGRREGASLFMTLLSAFGVLLYKYTGHEDLSIGTPVAARVRPELEGLIGLFVNTLVMRCDLSGDPSFRNLLARVREVALGAYAHADLPFERLVEEVEAERSLSHSPLFQVMFVLNNTPREEFGLPGLEVESLALETGTSKFDLTLAIDDDGESLNGTVEYKTELFEAETIQRLVANFQTLLEEIVATPDKRISEFCVLSEAERKKLLVEWNDTSATAPDTARLEEFFERQAARTPDAVALVSHEQTLTYAELDAQVSRLALHLHRLGVGPEATVGVHLRRTPQMVIAVLGILKAGGAYVPLDPTYPLQRLAWMVQDAGVRVALTEQGLQHLLPNSTVQTVCLDELSGQEPEMHAPADGVRPQAHSDSLAYVIYTSGSTGTPKGVAITHRSAVALINWALSVYTPAQLAGVLACTSLNFDLSVFELFAPLSCGGKVIVADNALQLPELEAEAEVTLVNTVPSAISELLAAHALPASAQVVNLAGEALPRETVRRLYESGTVEQVYNLYGPTEDTTYSSFELVPPGETRVPAIGRPVAGTRCYLLGRRQRLVPLGARGELFLAGCGLARGYLGRAALTAARFVPDPFSPVPGGRVYRTGDVARYLSDGRLLYLGRGDGQVKLRGYRIELGEVEHELRQEPGVREAAVAVGGAGAAARLVGYVVWDEGGGTVAELMGRLRERLPEYMVPSVVVEMEALPLTPNGKLDRKALPEPAAVVLEGIYEAPRDAVEEKLAGIWSEVLGVERVGVRDNFFDLGGHSLLATRIVSRIRHSFGAELSLRSFFKAPTVAELALHISRSQTVTKPSLLPQAHGNSELPLSFAQQRLWFLDRLEPDSSAYHIAAAVRLHGPLDLGALRQALRRVAARHDSLRTRIIEVDGQPVQMVAQSLELKLPLVDLRDAGDKQRQEAVLGQLLKQEARRGFDLSSGPPVHALVLRLGEEEHALGVTAHHIVSDGWSMGVLIRELAALYGAYLSGHSEEEAGLAELGVQYGDFAVWQRNWLQGEALEAFLGYWRERLADFTPFELPTDVARSLATTRRGGVVRRSLNRELTERLRELSRREGVTLFTTLLAAFQLVLGRSVGQRDVAVGTPVASRQQLETEALIGLFVNVLVMRAQWGEGTTFRELLASVSRNTLDAYAHQDLPFERLIEDLAPHRNSGSNPLVDILFNFRERPVELSFGALELEEIRVELAEPKFALTLYAQEGDGQLEFESVYRSDLFTGTHMTALLDQFCHLLTQIVFRPEADVDTYSLVAPEHSELLPDPRVELHAQGYPSVTTLLRVAMRHGAERPAVIQLGTTHSYRELETAVSGVAASLREMGVRPGEVVAVRGTRSFGLIVGMLAALTSRGVLLTVDPDLPEARQRLMLEEAKAKYCIETTPRAGGAWVGDLRVLEVDSATGAPAHARHSENSAELFLEPGPDDPAYVFFTSGTSGVPKGVLGRHRGLGRFLTWQGETFGIGPGDRCAQLTALSFDVVLRDVLLPLTSGATLYLPDHVLPPELVMPWLSEYDITVLHAVPSLARTWLTEAPPSFRLPKLRYTFFAGEVLSSELTSRWRELTSEGAHIVNLYGPTETTLANFFHLVPAEPTSAIVPVGRPLLGTQGLVFTKQGLCAGIGEPGEVLIRTPFRSLGYLNVPEENERRFRGNPFRQDDADLLYYTGDRGRFRPDGTLEVLGRLDEQVKIRGARVEVGEVQFVLTESPDVEACAVVARQDKAGELRLAAYVVPRDSTLDARRLRSYLQTRLPDHAVPADFVLLERLPLTPNGKLDRRALPEPLASARVRDAYVAPSNPTEETLAKIWSDVLKLDRVGVEDNFFELGGHSLLATQVISRVRQAFKIELPLRTFFDAPTVAGLARQLEVDHVVQLEAARETALPPLSFTQQRLWFINQLEPGSDTYHMPFALRLRGELNCEAFARSFFEIGRRHEILRTRFSSEGGEPQQVVEQDFEVPVPLIDLSGLVEAERESITWRLMLDEAHKPFDLERSIPIRVRLLRVDATEHIALVTFHHIAFDGWSLNVFTGELGAIYNAYSRSLPSPLPDLPMQYADYSIRQQQTQTGHLLQEGVSYWVERLRGMPAELELPLDMHRPAKLTYRGASVSRMLDGRLLARLRQVSSREGVTLFMLLLAAFKTLLHRYSGQKDIVVGVPVANRPCAELEELIGLFVNTLVFRSDLSGDPSFRELLAQVKETTLDGFTHQETPFEKLVEALKPVRNLSLTPLVQVLFNMLELAHEEPAMRGLSVELLDEPELSSKADLTLYVLPTSKSLRLKATYNRELFDAATIQRILRHFERLLVGVVRNAGRRLSELPVWSSEEVRITHRSTLIIPRSDYEEFTESDAQQSIDERFATQARRFSDRIALEAVDATWSYARLDDEVGRIARGIGACVGRSGERVGVLGAQGVAVVSALLGVLRSGNAFVPLDPAYPEVRLRYFIEDSGLVALVTTASNEGLAQTLSGGRIPVLVTEEIDRDSTTNAPAGMSDLAYLLYTSATTGRPKGVMQTQGNLLRHVRNHTNYMRLGSRDRVTLLSSFGFDAGVLDIFSSLLNGATLVMRDIKGRGLDGLAEWLRETRVSVFHSTPTVFRAFLSTLTPEQQFPDMRLVVLGGEESTAQDLRGFQRHFAKECVFANGLGPSECTVALHWLWRAGGAPPPEAIPVGHPMEDTLALLVDEHGNIVGPCGRGEIVLRSRQVSPGYWGQPELTARSFKMDGDERTYRTGDLGRFNSAGSLVFVGRRDRMIKLRGHRIELGEVETALAEQPGISEAVVVLNDNGDEKRLVGYWVGYETVTQEKLRGQLKKRLPMWMVPAVLVRVEHIPRTPNGKLDQCSLPSPEQTATPGPAQELSPCESTLAVIWTNLLGCEVTRRDVNFFDLGGHSLLATRLLSQVRRQWHVNVPLMALFEEPTLGGLAEQVEQLARAAHGTTVPPIEQAPRSKGHLPLSFAQQRLWFLDRLEPDSSAYHIAAAVRLHGPLDLGGLRQALRRVAARHDSLRTRIIEVDGQPVQMVAQSLELKLPLVDLRDAGDKQRQEAVLGQLLKQEARRGFDLSSGPPVHALVLRLGEEEHALGVTAHHIVSDGWSMGVLIRELAALYGAYVSGHSEEEAGLAELGVQYGDFAVWQRNWLQGEALETQLKFWKEQLAGVQSLEMPTDRPRPPIQSYAGALEPVALDEALTERLRELSRREGSTLFMTLLATFQLLLSRYSGQEDIVVGTPIAGRTRAELEGLIGMFVNTLVMRTNVESRLTFRQLLGRVREMALGAYSHQDVPFEKLVEELQPARDPSRSPLFQTMFIFHNEPVEELRTSALRLEPLRLETETAKFDLTLVLSETGGRLAGCIEYNTDLFDKDTVVRMIRHLSVLLEGALDHPDLRLSSLPLLAPAERKLILQDWNTTDAHYAEGQSIHALFESQASRTPDAVALTDGDAQITYDQLNRWSNRLARYLVSLGVGPESPVAVCLPHSAELLVALLGVLKAGGCYVPMDPGVPTERLEFMLADSGATLVLTLGALRPKLPPEGVKIVCLDADRAEIETEPDGNLRVPVHDDSLLYVMYTSGSTGRPKAVLGTHRGAINRFRWMWERFPFKEADVWCLKTSLSFVDSVWECFGPLLRGVRTAIVPASLVTNADGLTTMLAREQVTRLVLVPSLLDSLVSHYPELGTRVPLLTLWVSSGEPLSSRLAATFADAVPRGVLVNLYGCSEVAADVTWHVCDRSDGVSSMPIGRPLANTQVYLLGSRMALTAIGIRGEICVGGFSLARGYLARADATAERFVPNPFSRHGGERLYRTGDLGRYLASGEIEYAGRLDHQVKLRGYRIETAEVEHALASHPDVRQALVTTFGESEYEKRLVAYVAATSASLARPSARMLHQHASRLLPSYMVPSAFVILDEYPLLPNGKINRRALPSPDRKHTLSAAARVEPKTSLERLLAGVWQEVLGLNAVGSNDNFFDLGGHSLALLRVRSQLEKHLGREVPLADLFTYPTVNGLSRRLADESPEKDVIGEARRRSAVQREAAQRKRGRQRDRVTNSMR